MRVMLRSMLLTAVLVLGPSMQAAATRSAAYGADIHVAQGRMEAQLRALAERLDQLETDNAALKGEVAALNAALGRREAEVETLKAQTQQAGEVAAQGAKDADKLKGAEWASRIKASSLGPSPSVHHSTQASRPILLICACR